ncbi:hypothetical protein TSMEX_011652 [Taenia solium]|eukprot:TsM_001057200 transcript=TsM_001057200 gene=TsM_001057200
MVPRFGLSMLPSIGISAADCALRRGGHKLLLFASGIAWQLWGTGVSRADLVGLQKQIRERRVCRGSTNTSKQQDSNAKLCGCQLDK